MEREAQLRSLAVEYAGEPISDEDYKSARESAERKLEWIIARFGTLDGERKSPYYLAQLIAEAVRASRFITLTQVI